MLVHLVLAIGAALRLPVAPGAAIVRVARVGALTMAEADEKKWTQSEDWALADAVPQFTVGQSSSVTGNDAHFSLFSRSQPRSPACAGSTAAGFASG